MKDVMVTARMSQEKKEMGNYVLQQLGTNASQVINQLYDYVIENRGLPFGSSAQREKVSREEFEAALSWVDSLMLPAGGDCPVHVEDEEIRMARLRSRGLLDGWDVP